MSKPKPGGTADGKPDGFRKPKRRPKGWYAKALKAGEIAATPQPEQSYEADVHVVQPPVATLDGGGTED